MGKDNIKNKQYIECLICRKPRGRPREFHHLHYHLYWKHDKMSIKEYKEMFPGAPVTSKVYRDNLAKRKANQYKALSKKQKKWDKKPIEERYRFGETPSEEEFFELEERIQYLKLRLFSSIKGEEHKANVKELGNAEQVRDRLFIQLWGD